MPTKAKSVAIARYVLGYSWPETAGALGSTVNAAQKALSVGVRIDYRHLHARAAQGAISEAGRHPDRQEKQESLFLTEINAMPRRTESGEGPFLTKDEEERLGESLRKALISDKPNPSREGCPDPKTLRDLAFHKRIGNPEVFERITAHMAECSACVRDALGYAEEYKEVRKRRRDKPCGIDACGRGGSCGRILGRLAPPARANKPGNCTAGPDRPVAKAAR